MDINDRARYAYDYYVNKRGLSPSAAAGIVSNLAIESGNFSDDVIAGHRRGDKNTAAYAPQLRGQRQTNFEAFASDNRTVPSNFDAQLDFVLEEMNPQSRFADKIASTNAAAILQATDPAAASRAMMLHYERPNADPSLNHVDKRVAYASNLAGDQPRPPGGDTVANLMPDTSVNLDQKNFEAKQKPSLYDPGVSATAAGLMNAGAILTRGRLPSYAPDGATDGFQQYVSHAADQPPSTDQPDGLPIGMDTARTASTNTQFGFKPLNDNVDVSQIDPEVASALTASANRLGYDLPINSGYRSQTKQDNIRFSGDPNRASVAKHSQHTEGKAVDISTRDLTPEQLATLVDTLAANGFTGFGNYNSHLHADMRSAVPRSFNPDNRWGGWTKLPPDAIAMLVKRGWKPNASASDLLRGY